MGGDLYDMAIAIQHLSRSDVSIISAGGEMRLYDANNPDLLAAILDLKSLPPEYARPKPRSGDIQISGPGTLQVIAGGNIDLGTGDVRSDGTGVGIASIGNARNPALPFEGASLITVAGAFLPGSLTSAGLNSSGLFEKVSGMRGAGDYFKELKSMVLGNWESSISSKISSLQSVQELKDSPSLTADEKSRLALSLFYIVLRESGRDFNDVDSPHTVPTRMVRMPSHRTCLRDRRDPSCSIHAISGRKAAGQSVCWLRVEESYSLPLPSARVLLRLAS